MEEEKKVSDESIVEEAKADSQEAAQPEEKAEEDVHKAAELCKEKVLEQMSELRASVDALEILTATGDWPYPSYGDMLFNVR